MLERSKRSFYQKNVDKFLYTVFMKKREESFYSTSKSQMELEKKAQKIELKILNPGW